jgi:phosphatidylserine decarboxylase
MRPPGSTDAHRAGVGPNTRSTAVNSVKARLFVALQYLLPRYWITRAFYRLTRVRAAGFKNFLITRFVSLYGVDVAEVPHAVPGGYATFNDFFTRDLRDGARPVDADPRSVVSPADGTLSVCGDIHRRHIFQAKGKDYSLDDLLAINLDEADAFTGGSFATIYLAPYNYHRVHAPLAGTLKALRYVPGDLFSVNEATVSLVPRLFARNERVVCLLDTVTGPVAVILVGALNVGSITTPWTGEIRPRREGLVETFTLDAAVSTNLAKGDLLGWFNMGSTVIVLMPPGAADWRDGPAPGHAVRMGEPIATLTAS